MKSFKKEYCEMMDSLHTPQFDSGKMERADKRYRHLQTRHRLTIAASAAVLFLLCTVGVQAAKNYGKSFIFADENGFFTADEKTALEQRNGETTEAAAMYEYISEQESATDDTGQTLEGTDIPEFTDCKGEELDSMEYMSYEQVKAAGFTIALPDFSLFGRSIERQDYYTLDDSYVMVMIEAGDRKFYMDQSYYGNSEGHSSSTVYADGLCNQRNYISADGYLYLIADSCPDKEEERGIHAAISVGDYELIMDMYGYSEEEAYAILDSMDLSVYEP